ncbi:hypothetical protein RND71_040336 [Anisodus tanguticus]|uniref:AB hydrolase-1 domain-containing protein n=1 Tax=Anisodus tanguticus TaxID=243964 RepID=A0AAE1UVM7_9SOLA|nr:hypothetical protein RND71_040336 [Anisodus tanguticus]
MEELNEIQYKTMSVNKINMHIAEMGQGPIVLFLHGFPELWYSWRHQMPFIAAHGYRAVAPDLRGFGDTTGAPKVGHDWGAMIAWAMCLYRPDKVKALVNMSVPFVPRKPTIRPIEALRATYGDEYYIIRFQEPGEIEEEFAEIGTKTVLEKLLTNRNPEPLKLPKGKPFDESPVILPPWLTEKDVDYYANKYEHTGFTGGLNYYRALDLNWELTAPWTGAKIKVPVKFIVGDLDITYNSPGAKDYIHKGGLKKDVPLLEDVVILEGVAHFLQQEKPDEVNEHIHVFFQGLSSSD